MSRVAAVTGATGYLGSRIAAALEGDGWEVRRLVRAPSPGAAEERRFVLGAAVDPADLAGAQLLVHAAWDLRVTDRRDIWRVNVEGTRRLLAAAAEAAVPRLLVLSSMSAYEGTRQLYGRSKLEIERIALERGGAVLRPGVVYSAEPAGMAGALQRVTRLPLVPLVAGDAHQYVVHLDDLIAAVLALADAETVPATPLGIADPRPIRFRQLLEGLAAEVGRRPRFVPVPWQLLYWSLRAAELLPVTLPFRADSLLGLARPAPTLPGIEEVAELGIRFRPFRPVADGGEAPHG
jgi:nucleoside-diphosphate-sugar epimerase